MMLGDSSPSPPFGAPTYAVWLRGRNPHSFFLQGEGRGRKVRAPPGRRTTQPTFTKFGTPLPTPLATPGSHPREPECVGRVCVVMEMGLDGMATPLEIFSGGWSGGACWSGAASARAAAPAAARCAAIF